MTKAQDITNTVAKSLTRREAGIGAQKHPSPSSVAASFADAYALWVAACANMAAINAADEDAATEAAVDSACKQLTEAEWRLVRTPAETMMDVRGRANAVQATFARIETDGTPTDNRHLVMLATLVADINHLSLARS